MFARLGRWCFRRRWIVVIAWVATLLAGSPHCRALGTEARSEFELPDVESKRGSDLLEENFGGFGAGWGDSVVFRAEQESRTPRSAARMSAAFDRIAALRRG